MTCVGAVFIALALMLFDFTLFSKVSILNSQSTAASLVFLTTTALIIREISILPVTYRRQWRIFTIVVEVILSFLMIELSMKYIWGRIQDYINNNSDRMLAIISEEESVEDLVCYLCCGKNNCPKILADILLKTISLVSLVSVCYFFVNT